MHFSMVGTGWEKGPHLEASMGVIEALNWAFWGLKNDSYFFIAKNSK
jgi:hypothetical protein